MAGPVPGNQGANQRGLASVHARDRSAAGAFTAARTTAEQQPPADPASTCSAQTTAKQQAVPATVLPRWRQPPPNCKAKRSPSQTGGANHRRTAATSDAAHPGTGRPSLSAAAQTTAEQQAATATAPPCWHQPPPSSSQTRSPSQTSSANHRRTAATSDEATGRPSHNAVPQNHAETQPQAHPAPSQEAQTTAKQQRPTTVDAESRRHSPTPTSNSKEQLNQPATERWQARPAQTSLNGRPRSTIQGDDMQPS